MKKIWSILMLALSVIGVRAATVTYNQTNGQLLYPTGFFRQHIIPGQGMVTQYGTGSNTLTLYVLTNSPSSPGMLPPWQTNALWSNGTWEQWSNLFRGNSNVVITQTPTGMVFSLTNVAASSSGMTIESAPATNLFSFGIIDLDDFGGGNWGIDINNSTIGTNKWTDSAYNWVLSLGGAGGGTTNGFGVNGVYRTDWNFLNSAVIVSTTSGGTNFYLSIVDGSIGTNKFDSTAYNLLITDAVGLGTNALVNGIKRQPFALTNNPGTGGVIWVTNASGEVLAYATNIPSSGGGGGLGTNFVLNGTLMQPAIITNGLSVVWSTNASGHIQASVSLVDSNIPSTIARLESPVFTGTVTFSNLFVSNLQIPFASRYVWANGSSNLAATSDGQSWTNLNGSSIATGTVADARLDPAVARLASPTFTGDPKVPTATPGDNDTSAASTAFVTAAVAAGGGGGGSGTNVFVNNVLSQPAKFTNSPTLIWTTNASGDILGTITNVAGSTTSDVMQRTGWGLFSSGASSIANVATNGVVQSMTHQAGDSMTEMVVSVVLTARSSTNYLVTIEVYNTNNLDSEGPAFVNISDKTTTGFKIQASSASGGAQPNGFWFRVWIAETTTVGGSGSGLTEAQASLLYHATNSTLTRVAGIGAGTTGDLLYRDANGWTNLAKGTEGQFLAVTATVPAWSNAPAADVQVFSTVGSNTWTKPSGKTMTYVLAIGGGGGGGAGRRGAAGTIRSGGAGGAPGGYSDNWIPTSALGSTETVTVGGGGAGASAQSSNDANGANGTSGTNSTFGNWVFAGGGFSGGGGDADGATASTSGYGKFTGPIGAASSATGAAGTAANGSSTSSAGVVPAGGGSGGGITSGNSASNGGAGGEGPRMWRGSSQLPGGTAGSSGGSGGAGNAAGADVYIGGSGGGGGASSISDAAGAGGYGGAYGAGGGGGGASLNGNNSGAGGTGGNGIVVVISY